MTPAEIVGPIMSIAVLAAMFGLFGLDERRSGAVALLVFAAFMFVLAGAIVVAVRT